MDPQAHAHLTDHVEVPYELLEWAKTEDASTTVADIQEKSKCISILLTSPRQGKSVYLITASTNGQRRAARSLLELHLSYEIEYQQRKQKRERMQSDLEATNREFKEGLRVEFAVGPSLIGLVIGKGGGNVVKVKECTGVEKIIVDSKTNVVRIKGDDPLGVAKAREMLEFKESIMKIPLRQIASLIGGNGKNINDIWKKSGCIRVHVDDHVFTESNKQFKLLRLVGTKGAVELGKELVDTLLDYDTKFKELRGAEEDIQKQLSKIDINYRDFGTNNYSQSRSNSNAQQTSTNRHFSGRKSSNSQVEVAVSLNKNQKNDTKETKSYTSSQKKIREFTNEKKGNLANSRRNTKNNTKEKEEKPHPKSQQTREPDKKQENPNDDATLITKKKVTDKQAKKEKGYDRRKVSKSKKNSSITKEKESSTLRKQTQKRKESLEEGESTKSKGENAAATQASSSKKQNQDSKSSKEMSLASEKAKNINKTESGKGKAKVNAKDKSGKRQSKQQLEDNTKEPTPQSGDNQTGKSKVNSNTKVSGSKRQAKLESKESTKEIKSTNDENQNGKSKAAPHTKKDGGKRKNKQTPKDIAKETKSDNESKTLNTGIGRSQQRRAKLPARKTTPNTNAAEISGKIEKEKSIKNDANLPLKNETPQSGSREEDDTALAKKKPISKANSKKSYKPRNSNNNRINKNIVIANKTNQVEEQKEEEEGNLGNNNKAVSKKREPKGKIYKQRRGARAKTIPAGQN